MNTFLEIGSSSSLVIFMNLFCAVAQALNCLALPIGWFLLRCYPQSISQTPVQLNSRAMSTCHGMLEWFSLNNAFFFFYESATLPGSTSPTLKTMSSMVECFFLGIQGSVDYCWVCYISWLYISPMSNWPTSFSFSVGDYGSLVSLHHVIRLQWNILISLAVCCCFF